MELVIRPSGRQLLKFAVQVLYICTLTSSAQCSFIHLQRHNFTNLIWALFKLVLLIRYRVVTMFGHVLSGLLCEPQLSDAVPSY